MERLLFAQLTLAKTFKTSVELFHPMSEEDFQVPRNIMIRESPSGIHLFVYHFSGTAFFQDDLSF